MPFGAAQLEDVLIWADVKAIDLMQALVIPVSHALPGISFASDGIPMGNAGLLIGVGCGIQKRNRLHRCLILRGEGWIEKVDAFGAYAILRRNGDSHKPAFLR